MRVGIEQPRPREEFHHAFGLAHPDAPRRRHEFDGTRVVREQMLDDALTAGGRVDGHASAAVEGEIVGIGHDRIMRTGVPQRCRA